MLLSGHGKQTRLCQYKSSEPCCPLNIDEGIAYILIIANNTGQTGVCDVDGQARGLLLLRLVL